MDKNNCLGLVCGGGTESGEFEKKLHVKLQGNWFCCGYFAGWKYRIVLMQMLEMLMIGAVMTNVFHIFDTDTYFRRLFCTCLTISTLTKVGLHAPHDTR